MEYQHKVYRHLFMLIFATLFAAASSVAGPPLDTSADRVVDDFEGESKWSVQRQNNVTVELDLPQGLGHTGQSSPKVVTKSGPIGEKGRNAVRFVKRFDKPQDWSEFEGIQLWQHTTEGRGDMLFCLHAPRGVRYRTRIMVNPADEGQWKFYRFSFKGSGWDFESSKTTDPKVNPKIITAISIWRQMGENHKTVFYLDDVGLYKPKPPYKGPTISFSTNLRKALIRPDEEVKVLGALSNLRPSRTYRLSVSLTDFFDNALKQEVLDIKADPDGRFQFEIPVSGIGYFRVSAELKSEGKVIYTEGYSVGIIPELSEEQKKIARTPFGIWVGGVKFPIEHGARWYRIYCEPWRFEPDGQGGYRYIHNPTSWKSRLFASYFGIAENVASVLSVTADFPTSCSSYVQM